MGRSSQGPGRLMVGASESRKLALEDPEAGCHKRPGVPGPVVIMVSMKKQNKLEQYFKTSASLRGVLFKGQQSTFGKLT